MKLRANNNVLFKRKKFRDPGCDVSMHIREYPRWQTSCFSFVSLLKIFRKQDHFKTTRNDFKTFLLNERRKFLLPFQCDVAAQQYF